MPLTSTPGRASKVTVTASPTCTRAASISFRSVVSTCRLARSAISNDRQLRGHPFALAGIDLADRAVEGSAQLQVFQLGFRGGQGCLGVIQARLGHGHVLRVGPVFPDRIIFRAFSKFASATASSVSYSSRLTAAL